MDVDTLSIHLSWLSGQEKSSSAVYYPLYNFHIQVVFLFQNQQQGSDMAYYLQIIELS